MRRKSPITKSCSEPRTGALRVLAGFSSGDSQADGFTKGINTLSHVFDAAAGELERGEIILLDDSEILRAQVDSDFHAVLACPGCGRLNLITTSQYFGIHHVICGSTTCASCFRIEGENRLVYLPLN